MDAKKKYLRTVAEAVYQQLASRIPFESAIAAGSFRRGKLEVGDLEIVYIPSMGMHVPPGEIFEQHGNLTDSAILQLESEGVLERRLNVKGQTMYGEKNKLMRHVATGLPVDLFATNIHAWWNYLVCRTGPAESNTAIAMRAQERGWKWNPYGCGFSRQWEGREQVHAVHSEEEVFDFVGMAYATPEER